LAHRDLKLENVIVTSKVTLDTVILDFGFAEKINIFKLMSKAGTPGYIAPEVFENQPYTDKGDVFALGVIYYSMVSGKSPFKGRDYKEIMQSNKLAEVTFSKTNFDGVSSDCQDLIKAMMEKDPVKRLNFDQVLQNPVNFFVH